MRVVRIIARLNIGGPAIQAISLTKHLESRGYDTTLVRGTEEPDEGNMDPFAEGLGVRPVLVRSLRRNPGLHDLPALWALARIIRRERPAIVHTHAAKAGTLGRVATLVAFPRKRSRPILIHTYHGHSLTGYFSRRTAGLYRRIEQLLAHFTDRLIAVSDEVRDELVALRVAPPPKFDVVPLGFDLSGFTVGGPARSHARDALRGELGIAADAWVVTLIARLVPIKRVDRFLRLAAVLADLPDARFLICGDGELRNSLRASADASALGDRLIWAGFRRDMASIYFASDVVVQTSDNEGTPVSLVEAQAAGVPVLSTRVGGAASALQHGTTGFLVSRDDVEGLARIARKLHDDRTSADELGRAGQGFATSRFSLGRLVGDLDRLYERAASAATLPTGRSAPAADAPAYTRTT